MIVGSNDFGTFQYCWELTYHVLLYGCCLLLYIEKDARTVAPETILKELVRAAEETWQSQQLYKVHCFVRLSIRVVGNGWLILHHLGFEADGCFTAWWHQLYVCTWWLVAERMHTWAAWLLNNKNKPLHDNIQTQTFRIHWKCHMSGKEESDKMISNCSLFSSSFSFLNSKDVIHMHACMVIIHECLLDNACQLNNNVEVHCLAHVVATS